jgi:hypothetical protein
MPTVLEVDAWITANVLDSAVWEKYSAKQSVAVTQAVRNLTRWYPDEELTDELVSYQVIWELQGIDPALKYQKHGVKLVSDGQERIDYGDKVRSMVSPDVLQLLGSPDDESANDKQYGGCLI